MPRIKASDSCGCCERITQTFGFDAQVGQGQPGKLKPDGHTVHDYDERFALEDEGLIRPGDRFCGPCWMMEE